MDFANLQQLNPTRASEICLGCHDNNCQYFLFASFYQDYQESSDAV